MRNVLRAVWSCATLGLLIVLLHQHSAAQQAMRPPMPPNRRKTRKRSSMTRRSRANRTRSRNTSTPQICIRFCGRSMRSHAVSTADTLSRRIAAAMAVLAERDVVEAARFVARGSGFTLK